MIYKLVKIKYIVENQIEYFEGNIDAAENVFLEIKGRIVNLVDGIVTGDDAKVNKSIAMLIFGGIGMGILSEAIDVLETIDSFGSDSLEKSSVEWA